MNMSHTFAKVKKGPSNKIKIKIKNKPDIMETFAEGLVDYATLFLGIYISVEYPSLHSVPCPNFTAVLSNSSLKK
jgi:hypothetical protein